MDKIDLVSIEKVLNLVLDIVMKHLQKNSNLI